MVSFLGGIFHLPANKHERLKFILLTFCFALVLGSYTIAKELKDSVFVNIVGSEYLATAKLAVIFLLIPAIFAYSRLVDYFRRYQLLAFYSLLYGGVLAVFTSLLGHPTIGLSNTDSGVSRIFGWVFYFFLEGYSPFVVSVFWSFANSISSPKEARNFYPLMVAGSKIGGVSAALFAWYLLSNISLLNRFGCRNLDVASHQVLMGIVSALLLCVPVVLFILMKVVPGQYLHGYEAVYKLEKKLSKSQESEEGVLPGLKLLGSSSYILGIFALVFFYESLNVVLGLQRIVLLKSVSNSMAGFTGSMFWQRFLMHIYSTIATVIGFQYFLRKFGVRRCLMVVPFIISALLIFLIVTYSVDSIFYAFIGIGAINYSFSHPLREVLYIPTVKDMKFKAKAWIDSFGTKFSKTFGGMFAYITGGMAVGGTALLASYGILFTTFMALWFGIAWMLGKKYQKAVDNDEIIGC